MFNFFNSLLSFLETLGHMVYSYITSFFDLLASIPRMIEFLFGAFAYLPAFVAPYAFIIVSLSVVYLIIGRKGDS